jgi:hypothetical protein
MEDVIMLFEEIRLIGQQVLQKVDQSCNVKINSHVSYHINIAKFADKMYDLHQNTRYS